MNDLHSQPHTIVIGGGLAGLAAATYLARGGSRVTVLEKSNSLGGRASTDIVDGFAMNRGAHAFYTGGPASSVLKELGVTYSFGVPKDVFLRTEAGVVRLPANAFSLLRSSVLDAADKAEFMAVFVRLGMLKAERLARLSTADWIIQTAKRPMVRRLLQSVARVTTYTAALDLVSADTFVERFQQSIKHPVHYVDGGWQTIVDGLRDAAQSAGATILTGASAAELETTHSQANAVRLHDGRRLTADSVVIATTPDEAQQLVPTAAQQHAAGHIACLDVALSRAPTTRYPVVFDLDQPRFITTQSRYARIAPDGGAVVHAFYHLDPRQAGDPDRESAEMEKLMDEVHPGWRDVVVERRFLPRMLSAGWLPQAAQGGMAGRPGYRSPELANVYLAGDWIGPHGYLADAALASARAAVRLVLDTQLNVASRDLVAA